MTPETLTSDVSWRSCAAVRFAARRAASLLPLDPILSLHAGDTITTECTYENSTDHEVTFGESSDTEMCFSVLFRYPKQGSNVCGGAGNPFAGGPD